MEKRFETRRELSDTQRRQSSWDLKAIPRVVVSELEDGNFLRMGSNSLSIFKKENQSPVNLEQTSFKDAFNFVGQAP